MSTNVFTDKKIIIGAIAAVSFFAIATLGAKTLGSNGAADARTYTTDPNTSIEQIEDGGFESTLKNLSNTLYALTARKPEDNQY